MKTSETVSDQPKITLNLKALTWIRDSHGLFDYETFQLTKNLLRLSSECTLIRCDTEIRILPSQKPESFEKIATIQIRDGNLLHYI